MKVRETDIYVTHTHTKSLFFPGLYDKTTTCFSGAIKRTLFLILWEKQFL